MKVAHLVGNFMLLFLGKDLLSIEFLLEYYRAQVRFLTDVKLAIFADDSALFDPHAKAAVIIDGLQSTLNAVQDSGCISYQEKNSGTFYYVFTSRELFFSLE
jgi:hypothetical protein